MSEYTYENLKEQLQTGVLNVKFTKKNGEERNMLCTLMAEKLPQVEVKTEGKTERKENLDVLAVYDLVAEGWRSFRVESVINVTQGG